MCYLNQLRGFFSFLLLLCLAALLPIGAFAGTITAEKGCAVRVEGDDFTLGEHLGVYKGDDHTKPVAIMRVTKVDSKNPKKAVARLLKPKMKNCSAFKGMQVATIAKAKPAGGDKTGEGSDAESTDAKNGGLPKFEIGVSGGMLLTGLTNAHVKAPDADPQSMQLIAVDAAMDVFPLQFFGSGFIHKAIGLGGSFRWGRSMKDIAVEKQSANNEVLSASQQTKPLAYQGELIFRIPYVNDTLTSELRVGYMAHSLTHVLTKTVTGLTHPPLRSTKWSGLEFGLKQRYAPTQMLRFTGSFSYILAKGTVENAFDEEVTELAGTLSGTSGLAFGIDADFRFGLFSVSLLYKHLSLGGTLTSIATTNGTAAAPVTMKLSESYNSFGLGLGVLL